MSSGAATMTSVVRATQYEGAKSSKKYVGHHARKTTGCPQHFVALGRNDGTLREIQPRAAITPVTFEAVTYLKGLVRPQGANHGHSEQTRNLRVGTRGIVWQHSGLLFSFWRVRPIKWNY